MKQIDPSLDTASVTKPSWPLKSLVEDSDEFPCYLEGNYPVPDIGKAARLASAGVMRDEHVVIDVDTSGAMLDNLKRMENCVVAIRAALLSATAKSAVLRTARQRSPNVFEEPIPCADGYCGA